MVGEHARVIHFVDMVPGEDQHVFSVVAAQDVDVLVHRVGGAAVPVGGDALLRRQQFDELFEAAVEETPAALQVPDQALRLVLRANTDAPDAGIDAIGQGKIDDAELAAERHRRLGTPVGEFGQTRTAAAGENDGERVMSKVSKLDSFRPYVAGAIGLLTALVEAVHMTLDTHFGDTHRP